MVAAVAGGLHLERFVQADGRFHAGILRTTRNALLEQMAQAVFSELTISFYVTTALPGSARRSLPRHRRILEAIREGRGADARRAMAILVRHSARELRRLEPRNR